MDNNINNGEELITPEFVENNARNMRNSINNETMQTSVPSQPVQSASGNVVSNTQNVSTPVTDIPKQVTDIPKPVTDTPKPITEVPKPPITTPINSGVNYSAQNNVDPLTGNVYETNVAENNNNVSYYQEGQVDVESYKSESSSIFSGAVGSIILLAIFVAHYFLIAPFVEKFFLEHSVASAFNSIKNLFTSGSYGFSEIMVYVYTFGFLVYSIMSLMLIIYAVINIIRKYDFIYDLKKHFKTMLKITVVFSVLVIILVAIFNIDILTPVTRVVTLDGYQLYILGK